VFKNNSKPKPKKITTFQAKVMKKDQISLSKLLTEKSPTRKLAHVSS
jgi:hypothetical protein